MTQAMAARLRQALELEAPVVAPGVFDPLTARIVAGLGFPAVYLGGLAMGLHLAVGQPFITLEEVAGIVRRVAAAVDVPVVVDADAGFGDAAHTRRTVIDLERAGAAALQIDDQPFPKRAHYHVGKGRLAPVEEMVAKLRVAAEARSDAETVLIARTDAFRVTGSIDDVEARGRAYLDAGADMLMVLDLGPDTSTDLGRRLAARLAWIGGASGPTPSVAALRDAGFALAVYPFTTVAAVTDAVSATWRTVRETGSVPQSADDIARARDAVARLVPLDEYIEIERRTTESEGRT